MDLKELINYALGSIGIILTIHYFYKSREKKEALFFYLTFQDIKKLTQGNSKIKVIFENKDVNQVFTSYVWLWNRGHKPINKSDIPSQSPIKIMVQHKSDDIQILDCKILKTSRQAINFNVRRADKTTIKLSFDFLDHDDGAVLEIQHTGDGKTEITLDGVILGCPEGINKVTARYEFSIFGRKVYVGKYSSDERRFSKPDKQEISLATFAVLSVIAAWILTYFDIGVALAKETAWFTPSYIIMGVYVILFLPILFVKTFKEYPFPSKLYLEE